MPGKALLRLIPALALIFALGGACTADVDPGEMPDVDVQGGEMPDVDVDAADIDITTDTQMVVVPDVDVTMPPDTAQ